jgi:hypothetical protein
MLETTIHGTSTKLRVVCSAQASYASGEIKIVHLLITLAE